MEMKERILDIAQRLIQQRGINGFSYADIAKEVGVSKPSLHHHFATKTELVTRITEKYIEQLIACLDSIASRPLSTKKKLQAYCDIYRASLDQNRVCMMGMLSAEAPVLDMSVHPLLERFFDYQQQWLIDLLKVGEASGEIALSVPAKQQASMIISTLQGALIVSRAPNKQHFFEDSVKGLFSTF